MYLCFCSPLASNMEVVVLELMQSVLHSAVVVFNLVLKEVNNAKVLHCYKACTLSCIYVRSKKRCVHLVS